MLTVLRQKLPTTARKLKNQWIYKLFKQTCWAVTLLHEYHDSFYSGEYHSLYTFFDDFMLMISNCCVYNGPESPLAKAAGDTYSFSLSLSLLQGHNVSPFDTSILLLAALPLLICGCWAWMCLLERTLQDLVCVFVWVGGWVGVYYVCGCVWVGVGGSEMRVCLLTFLLKWCF